MPPGLDPYWDSPHLGSPSSLGLSPHPSPPMLALCSGLADTTGLSLPLQRKWIGRVFWEAEQSFEKDCTHSNRQILES